MNGLIGEGMHDDIMAWDAHFFDGEELPHEEEDEVRPDLSAITQKLGEMGVTSRQLDEERLRRVNAKLTPSHQPTAASNRINRPYLFLRDFLSLGEGQVDEAANGFNLFRFGLVAETPALSVIQSNGQPQEAVHESAA